MNATPAKLPRNMFKCFQCRGVFGQRDGNWFGWNSMQVHLCHSCDRKTEAHVERANHPRPKSGLRPLTRP